MMIDLFDNLNKKIYWIFHEPIPKSCKSKNVIKFGPKWTFTRFYTFK